MCDGGVGEWLIVGVELSEIFVVVVEYDDEICFVGCERGEKRMRKRKRRKRGKWMFVEQNSLCWMGFSSV
jgi:hypothetical protein